MGMKRIAVLAGAFVLSGAVAATSEEMVTYSIVDDISIEESLTGVAGDAEKGKSAFVGRKLGNCLACHQVTKLEDEQQFHGEVGPTLDGVMERYSAGELRLQVVNAKMINPDTIMPAFYRAGSMNRVAEKFIGKPILTAQQVEDIIAYLASDDFKE